MTRQGADVVRYAERMIDLSETIESRLLSRSSLVGTIRMGAADSFALTHLSPLLARLASKHPALHIELDIDFSSNLDRKLRAEQLDIAFLNAPTPDPAIAIVSLQEIELAWFASPRLKLPRGRVTPASLERLPILTNPRRRTCIEQCWDGLPPQASLRSGSTLARACRS